MYVANGDNAIFVEMGRVHCPAHRMLMCCACDDLRI